MAVIPLREGFEAILAPIDGTSRRFRVSPFQTFADESQLTGPTGEEAAQNDLILTNLYDLRDRWEGLYVTISGGSANSTALVIEYVIDAEIVMEPDVVGQDSLFLYRMGACPEDNPAARRIIDATFKKVQAAGQTLISGVDAQASGGLYMHLLRYLGLQPSTRLPGDEVRKMARIDRRPMRQIQTGETFTTYARQVADVAGAASSALKAAKGWSEVLPWVSSVFGIGV